MLSRCLRRKESLVGSEIPRHDSHGDHPPRAFHSTNTSEQLKRVEAKSSRRRGLLVSTIMPGRLQPVVEIPTRFRRARSEDEIETFLARAPDSTDDEISAWKTPERMVSPIQLPLMLDVDLVQLITRDTHVDSTTQTTRGRKDRPEARDSKGSTKTTPRQILSPSKTILKQSPRKSGIAATEPDLRAPARSDRGLGMGRGRLVEVVVPRLKAGNSARVLQCVFRRFSEAVDPT